MSAVTEQSVLSPAEDAFQLSRTELGRLFGVSRQAIDSWEEKGLPASRQEKAAAIAAIADLLTHTLKPERIPGVVRRPAPAYGGNSILEMIASDRHRDVLEAIRGSFDWASPA